MDRAYKQRIEEAFGDKPEELEHLYVDTTGQLRDRHIEDMFQTLFNGDDLDEIFKNNFSVYFHALALRYLGEQNMEPGPEIFTRPDIARAWVTRNFGLLYVGKLDDDEPNLTNETFAHCRYEARLRCQGLCPSAVHHCYAPYELHAILLTVVNLYRELAREYHNEKLGRS